jgi:hypothetical protein
MISDESSHRSREAIGSQTILISIVDNAYLVSQSLSANHVCLVAMIMIATARSRSMHGSVWFVKSNGDRISGATGSVESNKVVPYRPGSIIMHMLHQ